MSRAMPLLAIALTLGSVTACRDRRGLTERSRYDFERMRTQQRYDAYERSRFFANGAVLQAPAAHTVARDAALGATGGSAQAFLSGRVGGGYVTTIPIVVDSSVLAGGAEQFKISCAPCHGAAGFGGGTIAPNLVQRRPASLQSPLVRSLTPGQLFDVITNGFGLMPPYGWQMAPARRWAVIAYVRALPTVPRTAEARADSMRAEDLRKLDSTRATPSVQAESSARRAP